MKKTYLIGIIFLLSQVLAIIYARAIPERFFCWAPYDQHSNYIVNVKINGVELSKTEIRDRYRYQPSGWEPRSIFNLINIVNQYESTYGKLEDASVRINYSINGKTEEIWIKK